MNAQQLKNSILQEAISGRLVPQDAADEPASALLQRIRQEKAQLVKQGKLKKKDLEETPISDEDKPFDIPDSWEWVKLENLTIPIGNKTNQIQTKEIQECGLIPVVSQGQQLIDGYSNEIEKAINDIPLVMFGDHTRNVKLIDFPFVIGADGTKFFKPILCDTTYFYYLLQNVASRLRNRGYARHYTLLKEQPLPLPPLAEQKRIVAKIEELLPKVEEYGKAQEALDKLNSELPDKLKKSILQEAISGRLVPQDPNDEPASALLQRIRQEKAQLVKQGKLKKKDLEETPISDEDKPFDIPDSWEWVRLGELCSFLSRGKSPKYSEVKKYPVFAQKCNLYNGDISLEKARFLDPNTISSWSEEYRLRDGDVLVNSTGTGTVCRTRLFHSDCLGVYPFVVPDSHVSVIRTFDSVVSRFVYAFLSSDSSQQYLEDHLAGTTNQKELYISVLYQIPFPLPPLAEQKRIVAKIEELFAQIELLKH